MGRGRGEWRGVAAHAIQKTAYAGSGRQIEANTGVLSRVT